MWLGKSSKRGEETIQCDTCDSKKTTSLLEGARVYTHAYALCAREACLFFICAVAGVLSVVTSALLGVGWCRASICYAGERNTCGVYCTKHNSTYEM